MNGRVAVIEALIDAFTTSDQAAPLPADVHPDEVAFARTVVDAAQQDATADRPRYLVAALFLTAYRPGDDWDALLGRLTPFQVAQLRDGLAHMPLLPARLFAERYATPLAAGSANQPRRPR
jgi:hypothetical protein